MQHVFIPPMVALLLTVRYRVHIKLSGSQRFTSKQSCGISDVTPAWFRIYKTQQIKGLKALSYYRMMYLAAACSV